MTEPIIRELQKEDLLKGFLTTLDVLRPTSNIKKNKAERIFQMIKGNSDHIIVVAEVKQKIVGSATLLIEPKFIHDGGLIGHIEDVVVNKDIQGQRIGEKIMKYLLELAEKRGCYKTILNCTVDVKPFYEKLGFTYVAEQLRFDHT